MSTTPKTARGHTTIGLALVLVFVSSLVTGLVGPRWLTVPLSALAPTEAITGQPREILVEVPGPETGPTCPLDQRYVDEEPRGLRQDALDGWTRLRATAQQRGVRLCVQDGKRSVAQQQREFAEAVRKFGTRELASRYVLQPEESMHVQGIAVDVQPLSAAAWVEREGAPLGWCRRYENEPWHFEYDADHVSAGCPALLPSATGS